MQSTKLKELATSFDIKKEQVSRYQTYSFIQIGKYVSVAGSEGTLFIQNANKHKDFFLICIYFSIT